MRGGVAQDVERVRVGGVAHGEDLDVRALDQRRAQVLHLAVGPDQDGLLGELRADRARGVEPGRAVGKFELGIVG